MRTNTSKLSHAPQVDLVEQARQLRLQAEALEKQARFAKGTREIARVPAEVPLIGDELDTPTLMTLVQQLISERPMSFQDLLQQTGARDNRIKGVLMRLQREGAKVVNLGTQSRALWFLPNDEVMRRITRAKRNTQRHG